MKVTERILYLIILSLLFSCTEKDLISRARLKSDAVMNNLGSEQAYMDFPEAYFARDEMKRYFNGFGINCDYKNRTGKLIDYYYESTTPSDNVSFIYEYFLKCDSLRFVLKFSLKEDPVLVGFRIEPIEQYNPMLVDPSKSLLHLNNDK